MLQRFLAELATPTWVVSSERIYQSPLSSAPSVPAGRRGTVEDYDGEWYYVDFGGRYGVVICDADEIQAV